MKKTSIPKFLAVIAIVLAASAGFAQVVSTFPFGTTFPTTGLPSGGFNTSSNSLWGISSGSTDIPHTGPTGDKSGTGFYLYARAAGSVVGEQSDFIFPVTNISALTAPTLTFYYHMFGATMGALEVYVRNVSTGVTTRVFQLVGQQQTATDQPYRLASISLSSYIASGQIQVFLRAIRGSGNTGDIALDDIFIRDTPANDVGVTSVSLKRFIARNTDEAVSIEIFNFGTSSQSNFNVSYTVDGGTAVTESFTGSIPAGEARTFTFATKINRSTLGKFQVVATTALVGDAESSNNSTTVSSTILSTATLTLPYTESFEASNGGWSADGINNSWAWGTPAKTVINRASDGTKAWVTSLAGNHSINERSFVVSPFFSISGISEVNIEMDIMYRTSGGGAVFQSSTDGGGHVGKCGCIG
ncbi:MAG: hypothetical protein ORN54_09285 [Cyclobacteriaceae bacterium]|nr:hypothetical protein [Cyclobacteriaceae bacterium]